MGLAAASRSEFALTTKQRLATQMLARPGVHDMLFGGSRSGKTFALLRALVVRALGADGSRHLIARFRFNHVKASVINDTLPKLFDLCWPGLWGKCKLDKQDWILYLPNGSELVFAGLDDKERTEKILGMEFATVFLNECSQIPWSSRVMVISRLAQKVRVNPIDGQAPRDLRLRMFYDCNPPSQLHWTYRLFIEKKDPATNQPLRNPEAYNSMLMNPTDNLDNLSDEYIAELENMPAKERNRFLLGMFSEVGQGQLWTYELLEQQRIDTGPDMQRIVIAVDPSGCRGPEDERSDEIGIVVCGLGFDQKGYLLEDLSGRHGATGNASWGRIVVNAYERLGADRVIYERNYGGDMVKATIEAAADGDPPPMTEVTASRGKAVRADPISTLFDRDRIKIVGRFPDLEEQLVGFTQSGYVGDKSPDRADAMVWGFTHLFPSVAEPKEASPDGTFDKRYSNPTVIHSPRMKAMRRGRR